jgi:hypothetical protein
MGSGRAFQQIKSASGKASAKDIAAIPGISEKSAEAILEWLG